MIPDSRYVQLCDYGLKILQKHYLFFITKIYCPPFMFPYINKKIVISDIIIIPICCLCCKWEFSTCSCLFLSVQCVCTHTGTHTVWTCTHTAEGVVKTKGIY